MICSAIWNLLEKMKNKQDISTLNSGLIKWDECVHAQSCPAVCNPMDYPARLLCPWNFQARILDWIAIPFSRRSSQPRDWTCVSYVSYIGRQILYRLSPQGSPSNGIVVVLFSHPVTSDSLWPHRLQHARPHHLPEFAQVNCIGDTIQASHPLTPSSSSALDLSQHQGLFQWVICSHQVTEILELQHQYFQWIFRVDLHLDWLVWSSCCPRDSQESSPAP